MRPHLSRYQEFVSSLQIPDFNFYVGQTSKAVDPEKTDIKNIYQKPCATSEDNTKSIQDLWDKFLELNSIFSKCPQELTSMDIQLTFEEKAEKVNLRYHVNNVTPYIYATMNHVPEFLQSILPFTQQGHNDITTKINFIFTSQIIRELTH